MTTKKTSRRGKAARTAGPKPAPGDLRILQELVNSLDLRTRTDTLSTSTKVRDWLIERRLLEPGAELTKADVGRVQDVRDGVRALIMAQHGFQKYQRAVAALDRAVEGARPQIRFHQDLTCGFAPGDLSAALGHLAGLVVITRAAGLWKSFKICADRGCLTAFYDYSNNQTAIWCTRRCGSRIRVRRLREYRKKFHELRPLRPLRIPPYLREYLERNERDD